MQTKELEKLIRNLGYTYQALINNDIIRSAPPVPLYEDSDSLEIDYLPGMELVFSLDGERFEIIYLKFGTGDNSFQFKENLPFPLNAIVDLKTVREALGKPVRSASQMELFETELYGWDTYYLSENLHSGATLDIQYDANQKIKYMLISIMDSEL